MNGEPWVAEWFLQAPGMPKYLEARYNENLHLISITAILPSDSIAIDKRMSIMIHNPLEGTSYKFPNVLSEYQHKVLCGNQELYQDTLDNDHYLRLSKFDISNRIASGEFSSKFIKEGCQDTILVEEGRFDVKFSIIQ